MRALTGSLISTGTGTAVVVIVSSSGADVTRSAANIVISRSPHVASCVFRARAARDIREPVASLHGADMLLERSFIASAMGLLAAGFIITRVISFIIPLVAS